MKTRILLVLLVPLLWSCATAETRPAVDASAYLFDLDVAVSPELVDFDPDVAKGGGSGALRGAGMGFGGCIMVGLEADATSGGSTFLLGTALGVVLSPACALVGSVIGGGMAETKEDVAARIAALNDMALELDYPSDLARLLAEELKSGSIYHIAQFSEDRHEAYVTPEPSLSHSASDTAGTVAETKAVLAPGTNYEDTLPAVVVRPTEPNAKVQLNITGYGLTGGGIDPKMPLQLTATLCVTQYATGEALVSRRLTVASKPMRLEDWAALGPDGLEAETQSLVHRLSAATQAAMGAQVKLDYKTSCDQKTLFGRLVPPVP